MDYRPERSFLPLSLVVALALPGNAAAQLPVGFATPEEALVVTLRGEGVQIYECKAGGDGKLIWTLREPKATLRLKGKTVGRYYAGPNWEHIDGSGVAANVVANALGKTPNDIPWLKLKATSHRGRGTFSGVTTVLQINTQGGVHSGPCDKAGDLYNAPYAADYMFLQQGG
jgi:hypothetical protein